MVKEWQISTRTPYSEGVRRAYSTKELMSAIPEGDGIILHFNEGVIKGDRRIVKKALQITEEMNSELGLSNFSIEAIPVEKNDKR